ncbi:hypothetical protein QFZ79_000535 [Arthrobacter sp. V4I6]|uniref:hypothetical protein n=1 Tax=unclassified Arthrobacter TaxID=235627 RepID=UPI002780AF28|nr:MULTISPECIES: hypothetical protein [unclassified Arthrobacter]MDQ0822795.1 hypothetical protein [Arthrobacter sp. V1I7]MDQ0852424.1 hypothetical protein [Arthrobacter sp. V4I6]
MTLVDVDFTRPKNRYELQLPVPGPAWREAPVDTYDVPGERELGLLIGNLYFTADMFHILPEHTDWRSVKRGDIAILGRVDLDWHMLDLVLMDDDGYLKSASISFLSIWLKPQTMRSFLFRCWDLAPLILTNETPYQRSTK